jgi:hypothetical protein
MVDDSRTTLEINAWCVFELDIGKLKEIREDGGASFTDGYTEISGRLFERLRPLTLRNMDLPRFRGVLSVWDQAI